MAKRREADGDDFYGINVVVLQGELTSEPLLRELPTGDEVTNLEVSTPMEDGRHSVPVVVHSNRVDVEAGDRVVVVGLVRRRFFRAGAGVQSRTEVVATSVVKATQAARVRRAVGHAVEELSTL